MEPAPKQHQPLSLEKICTNALARTIRESDIHQLTLPDTMKQFSLLSDKLNHKVTTRNFCYKFGHRFAYQFNKSDESYEPNDKKIDYEVMLDEINNQVMVKEEHWITQEKSPWLGNCTSFTHSSLNEDTLKTFAMNGKEICSFPYPEDDHCMHSGSLLCHASKNSILILKNGTERMGPYKCPVKYFWSRRLFLDRQELHFHNRQLNSRDAGKHSLFNFSTQSMIYENADFITFNTQGTVCMVKKGNTVIISDRTCSSGKCEMIIKDAKEATLSPNGELLFVLRDNQPAQLISLKDGSVIFSFKDIPGETRAWCAQFSDDGHYLITWQCIPRVNGKQYILDIQSKAVCLVVTPPSSTNSSIDELSFYAKYLVSKRYIKETRSYSMHLIPLKNLRNIRDFDDKPVTNCTLENLITLGITKVFNNFEKFHPNSDFIITYDANDKTWRLVHVKSKEVVTGIKGGGNIEFSEPAGKIVCLESSKGHEIFLMRNDLTIPEYLVNRFMTEKNISVEDLSHYLHLQKIYNDMDKDKQLFCSHKESKNSSIAQEHCIIN